MPINTEAPVEQLLPTLGDFDNLNQATVEGDGDSAADESSLQPLSEPPDVSAVDFSSVRDITVSQAPAPPVDSSDAR